MTKSNYVRFEQNLVDIGASKLLQIVSRLNISLEELKFIDEDYQVTQETRLWRCYAIANNFKDVETLLEIYQKNKHSSDKRSQVISALCKITIQNLNSQSIDVILKQQIIDYLSSIDLWTLDEISIFTASYYLFNEQAQSNLMMLCYQGMKKYQLWPNFKERILNLLNNYVYYCYLHQRIEEADYWLIKLNTIAVDTTTIYQSYFRILCNDIANFLHLKQDNRAKMVSMDDQLRMLLGQSTLLAAYDMVVGKYQ